MKVSITFYNSMPDPDEVLAELFRHRSRLLGHDGVFVIADYQGLFGLEAVTTTGTPLETHDLCADIQYWWKTIILYVLSLGKPI